MRFLPDSLTVPPAMPTEPHDRMDVDVNRRRIPILIAALAVGVLSSLALAQYVNGVERDAAAGTEQVMAIRLARDVPRGLTGLVARDQGYFEEVAIEAAVRPVTALADLDAIATRVAGSKLAAGQVLVDGMFIDPSDLNLTAARRVPEGEVAITVSVDQIRGVAGLIAPGDRITVFVLDPGASGNPGALEPGAELRSGALTGNARSFYQGAEVLYVDRTPAALPGEQNTASVDGAPPPPPANAGLITFAVPRVAAQLIASVSPASLYFALESEGLAPEPLGPIVDGGVLPGEAGGTLTPYGPGGRQEAPIP